MSAFNDKHLEHTADKLRSDPSGKTAVTYLRCLIREDKIPAEHLDAYFRRAEWLVYGAPYGEGWNYFGEGFTGQGLMKRPKLPTWKEMIRVQQLQRQREYRQKRKIRARIQARSGS